MNDFEIRAIGIEAENCALIIVRESIALLCRDIQGAVADSIIAPRDVADGCRAGAANQN